MMLRALLLLTPGEASRWQTLFPDGDVEIRVHEPREVLPEAAELVLVRADDLPEPWERTLGAWRSMPEAPEPVVLLPRGAAAARARLQAAGCLVVVDPEQPDEILRRVLQEVVSRRQRERRPSTAAERTPLPDFEALGAQSPPMRKLLALAARVAASNTSLLVLGETGSGKEWLVRGMHSEGPRAAGPFVAVNCGAIPEGLLESELFGHERGAFTGATQLRRGHFEMAHRGTLLLDEIADLPLHLQVKLLRALQEHRIQRLGSERTLEVDVRVVGATHRDLHVEMKEGRFRQDLYYRLAVVTLVVPPLRDRPEDIIFLAESHRKVMSQRLRRPAVQGFKAGSLAALQAYRWPGNVRELANVIERAVLLCEGDSITPEDLPHEIAQFVLESTSPAVGVSPTLEDRWLEGTLAEARDRAVEEIERAYLVAMLRETRGRIGETADRAGLDPRTLYAKMRRLGLSKEDFRPRRRMARKDEGRSPGDRP